MHRGGFGRGFGRRRFGAPLVYPMGGWGMGSPLVTTLMAGGLGYMMDSNSAQQAAPSQPAIVTPPPPQMPESAMGSSPESTTLAQLRLLGELHDAGYLTDDEFAREKQRILRG